jgi:hypothetical protein
MSYVVTLQCGCEVYVSCHPRTGLAHTRVIERRAAACRIRSHAIGIHLPLWELLPEVVAHATPNSQRPTPKEHGFNQKAS